MSNSEHWAQVHAIRREAFASKGEFVSTHSYSDEFDSLPNSFTFLLQSDKQPIGTIRLTAFGGRNDWTQIPAFGLYAEELDGARQLNRAMLQSSLFAVSSGGRSLDLTPKLLLLREFLRLAIQFEVEQMITVVRNWPTQLKFYARMGLVPMSPPKQHPWANVDTVLLSAHPKRSLSLVRASPLLGLVGVFDEAYRNHIDADEC